MIRPMRAAQGYRHTNIENPHGDQLALSTLGILPLDSMRLASGIHHQGQNCAKASSGHARPRTHLIAGT